MSAPRAKPSAAVLLAATERHPHAHRLLAAVASGGAASHAYLFHGPGATGKREAARALAGVLLAQGAADEESVLRRVARGAHPDLTWVTPSGAHELRVADVEAPVVAAATRTPFEAERRVFVIERADTMHDAAGNRLLKTLEEPAAFVHLILITDRPADVMGTVASRCQHVRFDALGIDDLAGRLECAHGVPAEQARACARLARGDGARALELATGAGPQLRAAAQLFAAAALSGEMARAPWTELLAQARARGDAAVSELEEGHAEALEHLDTREQRRAKAEQEERRRRVHRRSFTAALDLTLALVGLWFRDLACVAWGAGELVCHDDRRAELEAGVAGRDPGALRAAVDLVEGTRQRLPLNVSEELACEALGYRLERLLARSPA